MKNSNRSIAYSNIRLHSGEGKNPYEGNVVRQVVIWRKPDLIPLKIRWPLSNLDEKTGLFLPRHRSDKQCLG